MHAIDVTVSLQGIVEILTESNERMDPKSNLTTHNTGFLPLHPLSLKRLAMATQSQVMGPRVSLDLMCGNGGWALMSAALGHPSYGIDINPLLVEEARCNHGKAVAAGFIDKNIPCRFAVGNVFVDDYYDAFITRAKRDNYSSRYSPRRSMGNPYQELGTNVADAEIIYSFCWSGVHDFLCEFLDKEASPDALFILPNFESDKGVLNLEAVTSISGPYQVMRRRRS